MKHKTSGSPPLTRGPRRRKRGRRRTNRITPAYAGTTRPGAAPAGRRRDHPRLRGDHHPADAFPVDLPGSPPLTRGPRRPRRQGPADRGITPAYAGTTRRAVAGTKFCTDHPRLRGDHASIAPIVIARAGSPPLTRGPLCQIQVFLRVIGITPAYAGTTFTPPCPLI